VSSTRPRLSAGERRAALVDAALAIFAEGAYGGATTVEIARRAGVSEPILYRHFASKRDLYFACLEESWARLRRAIDEVVAEEDDPREWPLAAAKAVRRLRDRRALPLHIWIQALGKASDDPEIRRYLRKHLREVHAYFTDLLRRAQAAGALPPERNPDAEAWINLSVGLLRSVQDRLGGVLDEDDFAAIAASRKAWLTGAA
jgi:AcrR family transcriptional regulator